MTKDAFNETRHHVVLVSELARETGDVTEFFEAIPLREPARTARDLQRLTVAYRAFREASTAPLAALVADRVAKVRKIGS